MPEQQLAGEGVRERTVRSGAIELAACEAGPADGPPVVLLHGLATNREYVLMRSSKLERSGYRVISFDARGHGRSSAPEPDAYGYDLLVADLLAVMEAHEVERALLVGVSMGSHTALRLAMEQPERVCAVAAITPAYNPGRHPHDESVRRADRLAAALRRDGIEGFVGTFDFPPASPTRTEAFRTALRRQLARHENLDAVADALEFVMRARPFGELEELAAIGVPTLVVASHDEFDSQHPYAVACRYHELMPGSTFACEEPGRMPLAWNGGALSKLVAKLAQEAGW